jgi:hypothetical protein
MLIFGIRRENLIYYLILIKYAANFMFTIEFINWFIILEKEEISLKFLDNLKNVIKDSIKMTFFKH